MATFTLTGTALTTNGSVYDGPSTLTITAQDSLAISYQYSTPSVNPGYSTNLFGIPEAYFGLTLPYPIILSRGEEFNDEFYIYQVNFAPGTTLGGVAGSSAILLSLYDYSEDRDHVYVLSSTAPWTDPSSQAEFNLFIASLDPGVPSQILTTGPFAPGVALDLSLASSVTAFSENDSWTGTAANETWDAGSGDDSLFGSDGNDRLIGGAGNDILTGGDGFDYAAYYFDPAGVSVNLATGLASDGYGGTDTVSQIEGVFGSLFDDTLIGDSNANEFIGLGGDDYIDGGDGFDVVYYGNATSAVQINLQTGVNSGGEGADTLVNIERIVGTNLNDTLTGDGGDNNFDGLDGNDTISGGAGEDEIWGGFGDDILDGGADFDGVYYNNAVSSVTVNLATGTATGGLGNDTLSNFEKVIGSAFDDSLTGDANRNQLLGLAGDDTLIGGGGADVARYDRDASYGGTNAIFANVEAGFVFDGFGDTDTISGIVEVRGTAYGDIMLGATGYQNLDGRDGDDALIGGEGGDFIEGGIGDDFLFGDSVSSSLQEGQLGGLRLVAVPGQPLTSVAPAQLEFYFNSDFPELELIDLGTEPGVAGTKVEISPGFLSVIDGVPTPFIADFSTFVFQVDFNGGASSAQMLQFIDLTAGATESYIFQVAGDPLPDLSTLALADAFFSDPNTVVGPITAGPWAPGSTTADLSNLLGASYPVADTSGDGDDYIEGGDGHDQIFGGGGNDQIFGGDGNDYITGEDGDDVISDGEGDDIAIGGAGNDRFVLGFNGVDHLDGGSGNDTLVVDLTTLAAPPSFIYQLDMVTGYAGQLGNPSLSDFITNIENLEYTGAFDVTVTGDGEANRIETGSGNDTIDGGDGDDILNGGAGSDEIDGGVGTDRAVFSGNRAAYTITTVGLTTTVSNGTDTDTLTNVEELEFDDELVFLPSSPATVVLTGNGLANVFVLTDTSVLYQVNGFGGADAVDLQYSDATPDIRVTVDLRDGEVFTRKSGQAAVLAAELISVESVAVSGTGVVTGNSLANVIVVNSGTLGHGALPLGSDVFVVNGLGGNDDINAYIGVLSDPHLTNGFALNGHTGDDTIRGSINDDRINGGSGDDWLYGEGGADLIYGFDDNDIVYGGAGDDSIYGHLGADTLRGDAGEDLILGGSGEDQIWGGSENDALYGNNDDDFIYGEEGDDYLNGGSGNDGLNGGHGSDTLFGMDGNDSLRGNWDIDFLYGNLGNDTLRGDDGDDQLYGGGDDDWLGGDAGQDQLFGQSGTDMLYGGTGNDLLNGGSGDDDLFGGDDDDDLFGLGGNDLLLGEDGNDLLNGGDDDDVLNGGAGRDRLVGGSGTDIFVFADGDTSFGGAARDVIADFEQAIDRIDLSAMDAVLGTAGNDAFVFINGAAFSGTAGELRLFTPAGQSFSLLAGDQNGDGLQDWQIELQNFNGTLTVGVDLFL